MAVDKKMLVDFNVTNKVQDKNQLVKLLDSVKQDFSIDELNVLADVGYDIVQLVF